IHHGAEIPAGWFEGKFQPAAGNLIVEIRDAIVLRTRGVRDRGMIHRFDECISPRLVHRGLSGGGSVLRGQSDDRRRGDHRAPNGPGAGVHYCCCCCCEVVGAASRKRSSKSPPLPTLVSPP